MARVNRSNFGERVLFLRRRARLSQFEMAERIGYKDRSAIAKIETGDCDIPISRIPIFCEVLNCSPTELLGLPETDIYMKVAQLPEWKQRVIQRTVDALIIGLETEDGSSNLER